MCTGSVVFSENINIFHLNWIIKVLYSTVRRTEMHWFLPRVVILNSYIHVWQFVIKYLIVSFEFRGKWFLLPWRFFLSDGEGKSNTRNAFFKWQFSPRMRWLFYPSETANGIALSNQRQKVKICQSMSTFSRFTRSTYGVCKMTKVIPDGRTYVDHPGPGSAVHGA